jgi:nitrite reductase/ring-hydroxylating ferredoxin subunit/DMSO/TMAO reductase YedYZ heme-binding membrane subunit
MSATFRLISWTPYKKRYDLVMGGLVVAYLASFFVVGKIVWRGNRALSDEILALRALGTCAFLMLNVALCIGPAARLDRRFLPLLYNRRHLGVATFFVGLLHGLLSLGYYHGFGVISPLVSVATSNTQYRSLSAFPFEVLGMGGLVILLVMAGTSHDVWLKKLTPRVWKSIHMFVYLAWGLLVMHVALGALQAERSGTYAVILLGSVVTVSSLQIAASRKEIRGERNAGSKQPGDWPDVCGVDEIPENRGKTIVLPGKRERVALFRYDGKISALANVCAHQGGPLGEGKIINGCVTCPWHGFQYRPGDGCAPAPFTEKLATYRVRVVEGRVLVNVNALPPGTASEPAIVEEAVCHA